MAAFQGAAPSTNVIPMSPEAHVTERFTLVNPNTMTYELTYTDPKVWTAPTVMRMDWPRNEKYEFFEYACHEGDEQVRNYIVANRALREQIAEGKITPEEAAGRRRQQAPAAAPAAAAPKPQASADQPKQQ